MGKCFLELWREGDCIHCVETTDEIGEGLQWSLLFVSPGSYCEIVGHDVVRIRYEG